MSLTQKPIEELKFSDLRVHYGTGRSIHVSGTGRDKKFRYRHGAMTDLGDLEISEWNSLINDRIGITANRKFSSSSGNGAKRSAPGFTVRARLRNMR